MGNVADFGLIDRDGEIHNIQLRSEKRGIKRRTITSMYGPNWLAMPRSGVATMAVTEIKSVTTFRVWCYLMSEIDVANHIKVRGADISDALGITRQQASKAIRELRTTGVILDRIPWGYRLHPRFGWCGDPTGHVAKQGAELELIS